MRINPIAIFTSAAFARPRQTISLIGFENAAHKFVAFQFVERNVFGNKSDVIVGSQQKTERFVRAEDFGDEWRERKRLTVNPLRVFFDLPERFIEVGLVVRENEKMKFRFLEKIENAFFVNLKIRHSVARFDFEILVARVTTQIAGSVIDADLRDERKCGVLDPIEF